MLVPSLVCAARRAASLQKTRRRQLGDRRRRYHVCGERDRLVASYSEIRRRSCAGGVRHLLTASNFNNKSTPCLTICKRECAQERRAPFGRVGPATRRGCTERSEQRAGPRCAGACAVSPSCGKFRELGTQFMASVANFCRAFRPLRDFYCIGTHESARWDANVCTHGDTRRAGPVIGLPRRPKTAHAKSKSCHGEHVLRTAGPSSASRMKGPPPQRVRGGGQALLGGAGRLARCEARPYSCTLRASARPMRRMRQRWIAATTA